MSDFLRAEFSPPAPPPPSRRGGWALVRENLFGDARSTAITLAVAALLFFAGPPLWRFLVADAVFRAPDGELCRAPGAGACWAYIAAKTPFFIYGSYPPEYYWRVNVTFFLAASLIVRLLWPKLRGKGVAAFGFFAVLPALGFVLLHGAPALGLAVVDTGRWGGVMVSLLAALTGIVVALPGGVLLALGRRSSLPAVKMLCAGLIEFVRGVPLIAVLFMANAMLPLFLPPDWAPDRLLRPLAGIALFASAYMAEVVRAGLLTVPQGQVEGAQALGSRPGRETGKFGLVRHAQSSCAQKLPATSLVSSDNPFTRIQEFQIVNDGRIVGLAFVGSEEFAAGLDHVTAQHV